MSAIITAENITFRYSEGKDIIKNLSLEIEEGDFVAILGHNGSGKSTFAKHLNAILTPSEGKVTVAGLDTSDDNNLAQIRRTVGMVFQNPDNQIIATVVEEDVAFALENLGVEQNEMIRRVDEALETVGMLKLKKHSTTQLSGGQKQRIAIAGILAMQPKCIVLDEPTAMLDPKGRREVMDTIKQLNKELGITVVLITHYMDEAAMCDRVAIVDDGKVIMDSTPREVFAKVDEIKKIGLDVPQVTELCHELKKEGFDLPDCVLTEEECVAALEKLLKGGENNG